MLRESFEEFLDDSEPLRREGLAKLYCHVASTTAGAVGTGDLEALAQAGALQLELIMNMPANRVDKCNTDG